MMLNGMDTAGWNPQQVTNYQRYMADPNGYQSSIWDSARGMPGSFGADNKYTANPTTPTMGSTPASASVAPGGFSMVGGGNYDASPMGPTSMRQNTGYAPDANLGMGGSMGGASGNPYLGAQADAITRRMTDNMQRNVLPGIGQGAMAAGGYGDSRQGVLESNAMKDMNLGLGDSLSNLYGTAWNADQNRNLQQYQGDQSFYTQQRGQDQTGAALGASLYNQGSQGQWSPIQNAAQAYSPFTGLGTTTNTQNTGGGASGALGGALAGYTLGKNIWS